MRMTPLSHCFALVLLGGAFAAVTTPTASAEVIYQQNFTGTTGSDPVGWSNPDGLWGIDGNNEYRSTITTSDNGPALSLYNTGAGGFNWTNYSVTAEWRYSPTGYGGIIGRAAADDTYYHFRYIDFLSTDGFDGTLQLLRFVDGAATELDAVGFNISGGDGTTYLFRLSFVGNTITAQVTETNDPDFLNPPRTITVVEDDADVISSGGVGLRSVEGGAGGSAAYTTVVDNVVVEVIPEPGSLSLIGGLFGATLMTGRRRLSR